MLGKLSTQGRRYTIGGKSLKPKEFVARSGFKFCNFLIEWALTGSKEAIFKAEAIIEDRFLGVGVQIMRAPHDYRFWQGGKKDFWDTPSNYHYVLDLTQKPGGTFRLSAIEKKVIRKQVKLGIKRGIWFDKPYLFTIKHHEPRLGDPRESQKEVNIWNGHYLAAMGRYMYELKAEFGHLPFIHEIANEFNTCHPPLSTDQIAAMCQRWHVRDAFEMIGIDQAGPPINRKKEEIPYIPRLGEGAWSPDDIRLHPDRSMQIPWWKIGGYINEYFGDYKMPIYVDETIFLLPRAAYDALPQGHGWRSLGTKSKKRYGTMVEDLWAHGFYVCIHDGGSDSGSMHGGGLSAGWVPGFDDKPGTTDDFLKELMGVNQPPPPPDPDPPEPAWWERLLKWLIGLMSWKDVLHDCYPFQKAGMYFMGPLDTGSAPAVNKLGQGGSDAKR